MSLDEKTYETEEQNAQESAAECPRAELHVPEQNLEETTWWVPGRDTKSKSARRRAERRRKLMMIYVVVLLTTFGILILGGVGWIIFLACVPETSDVFTPKARVIAEYETGFGGAIMDMEFSPDGKYLAIASADGTALLMNAKDGSHVRKLAGHRDAVTSIAVGMLVGLDTEDDLQKLVVLTGSKDMYAIAWNLELVPAIPQAKLGEGHSAGLEIGLEDEELDVLLNPVPPNGHSKAVQAVALSPDGKYGLTGGADRRVILWNPMVGMRYGGPPEQVEGVYAVAFNPNGNNYASAGGDGAVRIWNMQNDALIHHLTGHNRTVAALAFSHSGHLLISGSRDGTAIVWDVPSGRQLFTLETHVEVEDVALSADEKFALTNMFDMSAVLWDLVSSEKCLQYVTDSKILSLAMSPITDAAGLPLYVAVATADGKVLIFFNELKK